MDNHERLISNGASLPHAKGLFDLAAYSHPSRESTLLYSGRRSHVSGG